MCAGDVLSVVEAVGAPAFDYFGFSFGARVGYEVARIETTKLRTCACASDSPFAASMRGYHEFAANLHTWALSADVSEWQRARLLANDTESIEAFCATDRTDRSAGLADVEIPYLLMVGEKDDSLDGVKRVADLIPTAELSVIPERSHMDTLVRSEPAIKTLKDFLERRSK